MACQAANRGFLGGLQYSGVLDADDLVAVFFTSSVRARGVRAAVSTRILFVAFRRRAPQHEKLLRHVWRFGQKKEELLHSMLELQHSVSPRTTPSRLSCTSWSLQRFAETNTSFVRRIAAGARTNQQYTLDSRSIRRGFQKGRQFTSRIIVTASTTVVAWHWHPRQRAAAKEPRQPSSYCSCSTWRAPLVTADTAPLLGRIATSTSGAAAVARSALKSSPGPLLARTRRGDRRRGQDRGRRPPSPRGRTTALGGRAAHIVRAPAALHRWHGFHRISMIGEISRTRIVNGKRAEQRCLYGSHAGVSAPELLGRAPASEHRERPALTGQHNLPRGRLPHPQGSQVRDLALVGAYSWISSRANSKRPMRGKMMHAPWNKSYLLAS